MSILLDTLMTDPALAPQHRREFSDPAPRAQVERWRELHAAWNGLLGDVHERAELRKYTGTTLTGFGAL